MRPISAYATKKGRPLRSERPCGTEEKAMKVHKGEGIVCRCPQPAGSFLPDVDDGASISSRDIAISLPWSSIEAWRYVCKMCKATVAELSGDHRLVRTRKGWLE
jgi:hypothetical protein